MQEKAGLLDSLIAHNERMGVGFAGPLPGVENYTTALRHGLRCIVKRHGLKWPRVARLGYEDAREALICLRALRGYHRNAVVRPSEERADDYYLEAIEEAIRCVEADLTGV